MSTATFSVCISFWYHKHYTTATTSVLKPTILVLRIDDVG
jgi:hypothetical protein